MFHIKLSTESKTVPSQTLYSSCYSDVTPVNTPIDEANMAVSFQQWLGSVTERINQTMHYQFDGKKIHFYTSCLPLITCWSYRSKYVRNKAGAENYIFINLHTGHTITKVYRYLFMLVLEI